MKRWGVEHQLAGTFLVMALIVVATGMVGWLAATRNASGVRDIAEVRFPAVEHLLILEKETLSIVNAQRAMLSPNLTEAEIKTQTERVQAGAAACRYRMRRYAALPHTEEERCVWNEFLSAWEEWRQITERFLSRAQDLIVGGVLNPARFRRDVERLRADHYFILGRAGEMLQTEIEFQGGDDPADSSFERWRAAFPGGNAEIRAILEESASLNQRFHEAVGRVKRSIREGDIDGAAFHYEKELMTSASAISQSLERLMTQAAQAEAMFAEMENLVEVASRETADRVASILGQLVRQNSRDAEEKAREAMRRGVLIQNAALGGSVVVFLLSLSCGVGISRSISRSIGRAVTSVEQVPVAT